MKEIKIPLQKKYLIFRQELDSLRNLVLSQKQKRNIILDFSKTKFISRSFADALLNFLSELKLQNFKVQLTGLSPQIKKFLSSIKQTKKKIKQVSSLN